MPSLQNRPLKVFLCHASQDKPAVRTLYLFLRQHGIDAWLDEAKIKPGQAWRVEIPKAIRESDAIVVCLSTGSITKEGYVQKEIRDALDVADEKPEGTVFIIPARLDECTVPERLRGWQWVDLFREWGHDWLLQGLELRAAQSNIRISHQPLPEEPVPLPREVLKPGSPAPSVSLPPATRSIERPVWGRIEFVKIPAGPFIMGSKLANEYADEHETPRHTVDIPYDYWIGRFPITNEQFAEYIEATHYPFKWIDGWKKLLNHPVVNIAWEAIPPYLKWLNAIFGKELPQGLTFRLPTEAEWEKAARGTDGREWPWGNEFDKNKCNSEEGGKKATTPVGLYSPAGDSPYGCADMVGNVWEWTQSLFKGYPYDAQDGREDLKAAGSRVLRGGSFVYVRRFARCACRRDFPINLLLIDWGFRVAASPVLS